MARHRFASALLQKLCERLRPCPLQERIQLHIAAEFGGKIVAVSLAQGINAGGAVLVANSPLLSLQRFTEVRTAFL
jgi:hypothetical protein